MGSHGLNLTLRFLLEMTALVSIGIWGWKQSDSWVKYILVLVLPLMAATFWGIFNVPNDPSRSGAAPIVVTGVVRLILELTILSTGAFALYYGGFVKPSYIYISLVIIHYAISYDRVVWLIKQ